VQSAADRLVKYRDAGALVCKKGKIKREAIITARL
jgi:hypothetical protein